MISQTILQWMQSRSVMDLLLVFAGYIVLFSSYIYIAADVFKRKFTWDGAVFLAFETILFKPFLPYWAFVLTTMVTMIFVFYRCLNLKFWQAGAYALYIEGTAFLSDIWVMMPILSIKFFCKLIPNTSIGIVFGSLVESGLLIVSWIIFKVVVMCLRMTKAHWLNYRLVLENLKLLLLHLIKRLILLIQKWTQ